ncbi:MAG: hypothetical protein EOP45_09565 [Sphingobacteriaceae bacterium]|nr:MAG: hypothetical protein EOP45_09565 [Sphingobacteriaceae bacterium]
MFWDIFKWSLLFFFLLLGIIVGWILSTLLLKPIDTLGCHAPTELGYPMIVRRKSDGLYQVIISSRRSQDYQNSHDQSGYGRYSLISDPANAETVFSTRKEAQCFLDKPFAKGHYPNKMYSEYKEDANILFIYEPAKGCH